MKKKTFYLITSFITLFYLLGSIFFMNTFGNKIKLLGISYINSIYLILIGTCIFICYRTFKKYNFQEKDSAKSFRKKMSEATSNSFIISTIITTTIVILLFQFLEDILEYLKFEKGIINYTVYALKIFFVSIPFLGLEITIYKYFYELECYSKICKIFSFKILTFFIFTFALFFKYNTSSCLYARILTDLLFLYYFTKTCFEITIRKR